MIDLFKCRFHAFIPTMKISWTSIYEEIEDFASCAPITSGRHCVMNHGCRCQHSGSFRIMSSHRWRVTFLDPRFRKKTLHCERAIVNNRLESAFEGLPVKKARRYQTLIRPPIILHVAYSWGSIWVVYFPSHVRAPYLRRKKNIREELLHSFFSCSWPVAAQHFEILDEYCMRDSSGSN